MLSIGRFARSTGLTVKALRHYDERGLLVPATVDPHTRHRGYSGSQVGDAVLVKALRSAEVPLESVRTALAAPDEAAGVLHRFRDELLAARATQDAALDAAELVIAALADPASVAERDAPERHYASVRTIVADPDRTSDEDTAADEELLNRAAGELHAALTSRGATPDGPLWTSFGEDRSEDQVTVVELCLPVPHAVPGLPGQLAGLPVRTGVLPARRELVARWDRSTDELTPRGLPHPAFLALLAELERREDAGLPDPLSGAEQLRQLVQPGDDPAAPPALELAVTLP